MDPFSLLWLFFILASLQPALQKQRMALARRYALASISRERDATVITMIHRQEQMSLLGIPISRYIDIDDAESTLRAIRDTPSGRSIEIILHTPGGLVLAAQQIAVALAAHDGHVRAVVPHYAMSGGTLIALGADEIVLDDHAVLGPVDPQLGQYPAASIVRVVRGPGEHSDETRIMADVGRKALVQVEATVAGLLGDRLPPERVQRAARLLSSGVWTHDHPLQVQDLEAIGLQPQVGVPKSVRELMELYPQPQGRTPAVEYTPGPASPALPRRREVPQSRR